MWFRNLFGLRNPSPTRTPGRRPARLAVEELGDKIVPATMSISDTSVWEGDSGTQMAALGVTLSGPVNPPVTVNYSTASGSAFPGSDYTTTSGTLTFRKGETYKTIYVPVIGDLVGEPTESFTVNLRNARHATIADGQGVVTVQDNDTRITIGDVTQAEGNSGTTAFNFNVNLSTPRNVPVTVAYTTAGGSAAAGSDFESASGTVTFDPGETDQPITINVMGDRDGEWDEYFYVNLSSPTNALIGDSQAVGTIVNDEPIMNIESVSVTEGDDGTSAAVFKVTLSAPATDPVTVDFTTADNDASAGSDYAAMNDTLTFGSGDSEKLITVMVNGDQTLEWNESFRVDLSNVHGALLVTPSASGVILNDDGPIVTIDDQYAWETYGTVMAFTVTLSEPSADTVTIDFNTVDGWATAGWDYGYNSGTLTFLPGELTKTIYVDIYDDYDYEGDEYFSISLNVTSGNAIVQPGGGTGWIYDDDYYYDPGWGYYDPWYGYY
ncbi:MAG TPA: Calx-beta domain-containing protein [Gemmataceae bacterium]|nr:Calx-beta domain-containing protein [Gemmataceae bacterium]